jgi:hypothetical protein
MKARKAAKPLVSPIEPAEMVVEPGSIDSTSIVIDEDSVSADKTIEEQMAELEEEVMGLQTEQRAAEAAMYQDMDMDMEDDETEEGQIEDTTEDPPFSASSTPILSMPSLPSDAPVSSALRIPRGVKRVNAEDMMDNRPTSLPARLPPNKRRTLFGGIPQRPNRLVMFLDHSDSDSDSEDDGDKAGQMSRLKITSGSATPMPSTAAMAATAKLLAEKEEGIRKLKEQIEQRMKARIAKRATSEAAAIASPVEAPPVSLPVEVEVKVEEEDVVMAESSVFGSGRLACAS